MPAFHACFFVLCFFVQFSRNSTDFIISHGPGKQPLGNSCSGARSLMNKCGGIVMFLLIPGHSYITPSQICCPKGCLACYNSEHSLMMSWKMKHCWSVLTCIDIYILQFAECHRARRESTSYQRGKKNHQTPQGQNSKYPMRCFARMSTQILPLWPIMENFVTLIGKCLAISFTPELETFLLNVESVCLVFF